MGKDHLLTIAIPDYRPSVENVDLCPPAPRNASPNDNPRITVTDSFRGVTGMKLCLDISPNQLVLRIVCGMKELSSVKRKLLHI
ncbi:hypothetical protein TNCV_3094921 [Trichonephila clavipes]|nr:hypothetical protein TNCV_3094921 [Trichonephila clavipes]